jgi:DNA-binding MarR family transcriptional regulator
MSALKIGTMTYAQVLSSGNQSLAALILAQRPRSLQELAAITGRKTPNVSGTLHTMERYGLVKLERGERGCVTPFVLHADERSSRTELTNAALSCIESGPNGFRCAARLRCLRSPQFGARRPGT